MRFLFVMDPFAGMLADKDTSFAFMRSAISRGHEVLHCLPRDLCARGRRILARSRRLSLAPDGQSAAGGATSEHADVAELDAVFIRKDPPFDDAYLYLTQLLDLVTHRTLVLNDPTAIRNANEKLFTLRFTDFMPPTIVSSDEGELLALVEEVGGRAVIKPLDGAGGSGVAFLATNDVNTRPLIGITTAEGKRLAMVQEFQPAVVDGDKRVLLLNGELLGAIRRVPQQGEIRANIHVGGRVEATDLTAEEQRLVDEIGPVLASVGLYFVGLDLINGKLIEINVTSPTGIQELARLTGTAPADKVIEWVERRAEAHGADR